jgi:hypothetical protein
MPPIGSNDRPNLLHHLIDDFYNLKVNHGRPFFHESCTDVSDYARRVQAGSKVLFDMLPDCLDRV